MVQRTKARRRNRRLNVDVSDPGPVFIRKLARACGMDAEAELGFDPGTGFRGYSFERNSTPLDPGQFSVDYLWRELLSKFDDGKSSDEKAASALEKFREAEVLCGITNLSLSRMVGLPDHLALTDIERTLCVARRKVRDIVGKFSWSHAARGFSFTTGASTRLPRARSSVPHKYSGTPETTSGNADLAYAAICSTPAWKRSLASEIGPLHLKLVKGNRVTTVPKNFKTDRVIAIEPDMNMYIQKGIGNLLRERLKRAGVDLNSQETNQDLAHYGSCLGSLATIDLSMASDTVSLELVRFLFPPSWVAALELCRSQVGVLPSGEEVLYRKFSSMGNGYTFELESVIFYALALACCQTLGIEAHLVSVYGDDIVVPADVAPYLLDVLRQAGFKPNEGKTFVSGPFRESCGKHYFQGKDVQPFYIKGSVKRLSDLFLLHNKLYRWAARQAWNPKVDQEEVRGLLGYLRSLAPSQWRKPRIPDGVGDGAFIGSFDECTPRLANTYTPGSLGSRDGWEGYVVQVLGFPAAVADFVEDDEGRIIFAFGKKEKRRVPNPPDYVGRLLQGLRGCGRSNETLFSTPFEGGVSLPPRARLITIVVDGYR